MVGDVTPQGAGRCSVSEENTIVKRLRRLRGIHIEDQNIQLRISVEIPDNEETDIGTRNGECVNLLSPKRAVSITDAQAESAGTCVVQEVESIVVIEVGENGV